MYVYKQRKKRNTVSLSVDIGKGNHSRRHVISPNIAIDPMVHISHQITTKLKQKRIFTKFVRVGRYLLSDP